MSKKEEHATQDDVIIRVVTEADKPQIHDFLKANFSTDEPLRLGVSQTKPVNDEKRFNEVFSKVAHGTCLMASMQDNIVGVLIAGPKDSDEVEHLIKTAKNADNSPRGNITKFLAHVEREANIFERLQVDEVLHCDAISVARDKRGNSLGTRLLKELIQIGTKKGFPFLTLDCTGVYSQRICENMGMECLNTIYYRDYLNDKGEPVFHPPAPHNCIKSYALRL